MLEERGGGVRERESAAGVLSSSSSFPDNTGDDRAKGWEKKVIS